MRLPLRYEVRNAQNFYANPVAIGTYQGGAVTIPTAGLMAVQPVGGSTRSAVVHPNLQMFVVVPQ